MKFWKPGTKVSVTANVNGLYAGNGVYGQNSAKTHFTVGRSQITKINLASHVAKVYRNGKARPHHQCQRWKTRLADA